eukprot:tig00000430_g606.t1
MSDEAIASGVVAAFSAVPAEEQPAVRAEFERAVAAFLAATEATTAIGEGEGEGPVENGTGEGEGPVAGESDYVYALDDELDMLEADFAAADAFASAADDDAFGYAF